MYAASCLTTEMLSTDAILWTVPRGDAQVVRSAAVLQNEAKTLTDDLAGGLIAAGRDPLLNELVELGS